MPGSVVSAFPADIADLIQQKTLDRAFLDALKPKVMYRRLAMREALNTRLGETVTKTRDGLVTPRVTPVGPNDPTPEIAYTKEQWTVTPARWKSKKTTSLPNSAFQIRNQFLRDSQKLAEHAGQSIDRVARNKLYTAYCGGDTLSIASAASGQTKMRVAALAGFRQTQTSTGILTDVSSNNPLAVTVTSGAGTQVTTVVASSPDDANFPNGPGELTFGANLANTHSARARVFAANRPFMSLAGGVANVDLLTGSSVLSYTQLLAAKRVLVEHNVPTFPDGTYHYMIDPVQSEQMLNDTALRQFLQGVPDSMEAQMGALARRFGITFIECNENPKVSTVSGGTKSLVSQAVQAPEIGAEIVNASGIPIRRGIMMGASAIIEAYVDEAAYRAQAQGREGAFGYDGPLLDDASGYEAMLDGIRLHIRPPIDEHGDEITQAYSMTADWVPACDGTGLTSSSIYKRAVVVTTCGPA